jgi:hypothetical protein
MTFLMQSATQACTTYHATCQTMATASREVVERQRPLTACERRSFEQSETFSKRVGRNPSSS